VQRLRILIVLAGLVVSGLAVRVPATAVVDASPSTVQRQQPPQLRREGRWLVDPQGRVVIVHGLNLVYKRKPYVPPNGPTGFTKRDASWLARHGFNAARVGTLWAGLTPTGPGQADPAYLDQWQRVLDLLARKRIWIQLDMHQDQWHEQYGGEGVPDWAAARQLPFSLTPPVVAPFPTGYWTPEVSAMFDDFWANRRGLLDGWLAAWRVAAQRWKHQRYLMGYDLLNEPWMGIEWPTCLTTGCPASYPTELQPAMEAGLNAVRAIDPDNIVWWEPQQFAGGQEVDTYFTAPAKEEQLGLSWHNYCPAVFLESMGVPGDVRSCRAYSDGREQHALEQSERMHAVPMMSEWGATDNLTAVKIDAASADRHLMGWTHWAYKFWNDPTTADGDQGLFADDTDLSSVKRAKARVLVRTYAQAVAGTPLVMRFRSGSGRFWFRFRPDRSVTAPTRIFVSPLHYPHGYRVIVRHGTYRRAGHYVLVRANSTLAVSVRIVGR
jgi:cellulase (glycosyl hydrolase family 5)/glycosyl hydrolase family 5